MRLLLNLLLSPLILIFASKSGAVERAAVLPKGVHYATLRTAQVNQVSQKFDSSGMLKNQGDFYTVNMDLPKLMSFLKPDKKAELQKLVDVLNQSGRSELGEKMNLGQLKVEIQPDLKYTAPVFARGLTERFTLGVAFPVIQYSIDLKLSQLGSNIPQLQQEMRSLAEASPELEAGLNTVAQDLVGSLHQVVAEKGYRKLQSRKDTFLGDIQIVGLYQFLKTDRWSSVVKSTVILPTGPRDDPDDLTDVTSQHQTGLGATLIQDYLVLSKTTVGLSAGYLARLPDQAEKRVPLNEGDILPDADRKETLQRDLGDTVTLGFGASHKLSDEFELSAGYEVGQKAADRYQGGRGYNYDLLSRNSSQSWQKVMAGLEYSTVTGFLRKLNSVPYGVAYDYSDLIAGRNIEKMQIHEVSFKLFF